MKKATSEDSGMKELITVIRDGWPETKGEVHPTVRPYFDFRDELSVDDGIVLKGEAILVPQALRKEMKERIHSAHLGYDSMVRRVKGVLFWPGISKDIKQLAESCVVCQEMKPRNQKETLKQHDMGNEPWVKVGTDIFEIRGRQYLITIDYFSNFIEVDFLSSATSIGVIEKMKKQFARFGIPRMIVSDGGTQFTSNEFQKFTKEWGISHVFSSPGHQRSNGKAESAVKIVKHLMIKSLKDGRDQNEALLEQRNTPRQDTGQSPAEMMFGRSTRTKIPSITKRGMPYDKEKRARKKAATKKCHDKKARDLSKLQNGQTVFFEHRDGGKWRAGKVIETVGERSYKVDGGDGTSYWRNRVKIRPTTAPININNDSQLVGTNHNEEPDGNEMTVEPEVRSDELTMTENAVPNDNRPVYSRPHRAIREPAHLKDYIRF